MVDNNTKSYNTFINGNGTAIVRLPMSNLSTEVGEQLNDLVKFAKDNGIEGKFVKNEGMRQGPHAELNPKDLQKLANLLETENKQPSAFVDRDGKVIAASPAAKAVGVDVGTKPVEPEVPATPAPSPVSKKELLEPTVEKMLVKAAGSDHVLNKSELEGLLGDKAFQEMLKNAGIKDEGAARRYEGPEKQKYNHVIIGDPTTSNSNLRIPLQELGLTLDPKDFSAHETTYIKPNATPANNKPEAITR